MATAAVTPTPEVVTGAPKSQPVNLTPAAIAKVKEIMATQDPVPAGLRIGVVGGGCSGFQYSMSFENQSGMMDKVYRFGDLKVFLDATSAMYLKRLRSGLRGDAGGGRLQVRERRGEEHLRLWLELQRLVQVWFGGTRHPPGCLFCVWGVRRKYIFGYGWRTPGSSAWPRFRGATGGGYPTPLPPYFRS